MICVLEKLCLFLQMIGALTLGFLWQIGHLTRFLLQTLYDGLRPPFYQKIFWYQLFETAYLSLPVVGLTALFTGMVLALQSYTGFVKFQAENTVANVVVLSITRELGPVLGGLMVAGRMGAAMAAEIATMRVTEQIDALKTLSTNPLRYLVWPRLLSSLIALPFLVLIADIIGVAGGYMVGVYKLGFTSEDYLKRTLDFMSWDDVFSGLVKAFFFGLLIATLSCYHGYYCRGGAQGVGQASTKAVVHSSMAILAMNYILTMFFFQS